MSEFVLKEGQRVVFSGDSITDCGRRGGDAPYGSGYVSEVISLIQARYPALNVTYFNAGVSGNTVQQLSDRWEDDVLAHKPDWITVKIGINDLHRTMSGSADSVRPDHFETAYRDILTRGKDAGARLVLIDPFYISIDKHEGSFRKKVLDFLPEYLKVVHKLRDEFDALHVPTHDLFMEQLKYRPAEYFCPEPVHPYANKGHLVIAHGLLQALKW